MSTTPRPDPSEGPGMLEFDERVGAEGIYEAIRAAARSKGPEFWAAESRARLRWSKPFSRALDWDPPFARWFPDGELNVSDNCLDRHLGRDAGARVAYHWEGEPGDRRTLTYGDLHREVEAVAAGLHARGFGPSDTAAVYLPMVPELPVTMLALARLGIPFTVVFSGFSAKALRERVEDVGARLVVTADGGYRRGRVVPLKATVDAALAGREGASVLVVRRTREPIDWVEGRDVEYSTLRDAPHGACPPRPVPSTHPLFYLYSSGTTGRPKAIAHGTGGYLTHVVTTFRWIFDPRPEDVFWCAADIGWVTGHSYIVFGPLALGATGLLYEGAFDTPRPDRLWELVERYRATILYTSPTALRALRKAVPHPAAGRDLSSLRLLGTVGEAINPAVWRWYFDEVGGGRCPIVDTWWQTETGGALVSPAPGLLLLPLKPGSATRPLPGIEVDVVDESGTTAPAGTKGYVIVRGPWPGMLLTLRGNDAHYRATYWSRFPGLYYTGDFGVRDADGYLWFLGRADEVLKVAGHRLGTIEIEDALLADPGIAEAAVCARPDPVRGEVPIAFVVRRTGGGGPTPDAASLQRRVSEAIGPIARPEEVLFVRSLPKTRSGKIMRRVVRAVAEGRSDVGDLTTLEDEASVEEIHEALREFRRQLGAPHP